MSRGSLCVGVIGASRASEQGRRQAQTGNQLSHNKVPRVGPLDETASPVPAGVYRSLAVSMDKIAPRSTH